MSAAPGPLHVVIINWNTADETVDCVASVLSRLGDEDRIELVDNGSRDASPARLAALADERITLHLQSENTGFAHAANVGMRAAHGAGAEHVLLMNNDARLEDGCIETLRARAREHPEAGLLGPRIYADAARTIFWCCGTALGGGPNLCRLRGHGQPDDGASYREDESVDALTGAVLLVTRDLIERIGFLDEAYFVYVEDADYCARARAAGFEPRFVGAAVAVHAGSGSSGGGYSALRKYLNAHGSVLYLKRHGTFSLWAGFLFFDVLAWPLVFLIGAVRGRGRAVLAKGRGTLHALLGRPVDRGLPDRSRAVTESLGD